MGCHFKGNHAASHDSLHISNNPTTGTPRANAYRAFLTLEIERVFVAPRERRAGARADGRMGIYGRVLYLYQAPMLSPLPSRNRALPSRIRLRPLPSRIRLRPLPSRIRLSVQACVAKQRSCATADVLESIAAMFRLASHDSPTLNMPDTESQLVSLTTAAGRFASQATMAVLHSRAIPLLRMVSRLDSLMMHAMPPYASCGCCKQTQAIPRPREVVPAAKASGGQCLPRSLLPTPATA